MSARFLLRGVGLGLCILLLSCQRMAVPSQVEVVATVVPAADKAGAPAPTVVAFPAFTATPPAASAEAGSPVVAVSLGTDEVDMGETVEVSLVVEHVEGLYGAEIRLQFDATRLAIVDADAATEGIQVGVSEWLSPDFVALDTADNLVGTAAYAVSQMAPHTPLDGSGTLVRIVFEAKQAGDAEILIQDVFLSTIDGDAIAVEVQGATTLRVR